MRQPRRSAPSFFSTCVANCSAGAKRAFMFPLCAHAEREPRATKGFSRERPRAAIFLRNDVRRRGCRGTQAAALRSCVRCVTAARAQIPQAYGSELCCDWTHGRHGTCVCVLHVPAPRCLRAPAGTRIADCVRTCFYPCGDCRTRDTSRMVLREFLLESRVPSKFRYTQLGALFCCTCVAQWRARCVGTERHLWEDCGEAERLGEPSHRHRLHGPTNF
jgi:hypothetical protein